MWVGIDEASRRLGITPQSVRRRARQGKIDSRGEGTEREFYVADDYSSEDTGHDENDGWYLDDGQYHFSICGTLFDVPAGQVQDIAAWYTHEGAGMTQREVCRKLLQEHGRTLTRDYLRRMLKVLGLDKGSPPFAPHMLQEHSAEDLAKLHFARAQASVETAIRAREVREWQRQVRELTKEKMQLAAELEDRQRIAEYVGRELSSRQYDAESPEPSSSSLLLSPHFTDLHIGKRDAQDRIDLTTQCDEIMTRNDELFAIASRFDLAEVHIAFTGDIFHIDSQAGTTTKGTPQDVNASVERIMVEGMCVCDKIIARWKDSAPLVCVSIVAGNHDTFATTMLRAALDRIYRDSPSVYVTPDTAPLQVFTWGTTMVALEHGDGPKDQDYGAILSTQYRKTWGESRHVYVQRGHLHHAHVRDINGVTVQGSRSPAGADAWHRKKGYVTSWAGIDAYLYDKARGKVAALHA